MLGIIWVCERDMDTRCHHQLESDLDVELCLHGNRLCGERGVSSQKSVAGSQCHGREDQQGSGHCGGGVACGVGYCDQIYILRVSISFDYKRLFTDTFDRHGSPAVKNTTPSGDGDGAMNTTTSLLGF